VTGNAAYGQASWDWLHWYATNEQPSTGFVFDATMSFPFIGGEASTSLGSMDSSDAYAGTFLLAAYDTSIADPDVAALDNLAPGISGAVNAIEETQQPDGLTWATPTYQMAYLMDNTEAHAGLLGAARLEVLLNDPAAAASDEASASRMEAGIQSLWNPATDSFDWADTASGAQATIWSDLYPDAAEQAWAVGLGAATPAQASDLMSEVANQEPQWDNPTASAAFEGSSSSTVGYWPGIGWGFDVAGQTASAQTGAASIGVATSAAQNAWPYTTQDAGQMIVLLSGGPTLPPS